MNMQMNIQMNLNINRIFWLGASVVIVFTTVAIIKFGMRPQPISILKPSSVDDPSSVGVTVYKQTRQRLHEEPFLIVGLDQNQRSHWEVLLGLLTEAAKDHAAYDQLILGVPAPDEFRERFKALAKVQSTQIQGEAQLSPFLNGRSAFVLDQKAALHGVAAVSIIETQTHRSILSIDMAEVSVSKEEPPLPPTPCTLEDDSEQLLSHNLGCYVLRQSRLLSFNRRIRREKFIAVYEQQGTNDYLLYTHSPKK